MHTIPRSESLVLESASPPPGQHIMVVREGKRVALEFAWIDGQAPSRGEPTVVFLHQGLGSVAMWRDFPHRFCAATGLRGLLYSRYGYGHSTPRPPEERWRPDYLHIEALTVLPQVLAGLRVDRPWLLGHSDGATIALLYASHFPEAVPGLILIAPHIYVEPAALEGIQAARQAYLEGDLKARLAPYHADVDSAFWGWNDAWLAPEFADWNITAEIHKITAPVLVIQGEEDEFGGVMQAEMIAREVWHGELLLLPGVGHSPQRERSREVIAACQDFLREHTLA